MEPWKILAVQGGFYFFGLQVPAPDGYIAMKNVSMSGGFSGGLGIAGVARGAKGAKITLDMFDQDAVQLFPIENVLAIMSSVDLYKFSGTTNRK